MIVGTHGTGEVRTAGGCRANSGLPLGAGTHAGAYSHGLDELGRQMVVCPPSQPQLLPPTDGLMPQNPSSVPPVASSTWAPNEGTGSVSNVRSDTAKVSARAATLGICAGEYCE